MSDMDTDAISLLEDDHQTIRHLLNELMRTTERAAKTRPRLLERIATELDVHTTIEEEIFYPAVRDAATKKAQEALIAEALEAHRAIAELVLPDLERTDPGTIEFSGRAKVLKDLVEHHLEEEEEELFPIARALLSEDELEDLGEEIRARKRALEGREAA